MAHNRHEPQTQSGIYTLRLDGEGGAGEDSSVAPADWQTCECGARIRYAGGTPLDPELCTSCIFATEKYRDSDDQ